VLQKYTESTRKIFTYFSEHYLAFDEVFGVFGSCFFTFGIPLFLDKGFDLCFLTQVGDICWLLFEDGPEKWNCTLNTLLL